MAENDGLGQINITSVTQFPPGCEGLFPKNLREPFQERPVKSSEAKREWQRTALPAEPAMGPGAVIGLGCPGWGNL